MCYKSIRKPPDEGGFSCLLRFFYKNFVDFRKIFSIIKNPKKGKSRRKPKTDLFRRGLTFSLFSHSYYLKICTDFAKPEAAPNLGDFISKNNF